MHCMLDLETMSTDPNAAIISIGAVLFDLAGIHYRFYHMIDLQSSTRSGGVVDPSTILWWLKQGDEARLPLGNPSTDLQQALDEFRFHISDDMPLWGNGSDFDNVILANSYKRLGMTPPWTHRQNRCFRTMKALYPNLKYVQPAIAHNALADAEAQALHLIKIFHMDNPPIF
jgi:hypothetical protein